MKLKGDPDSPGLGYINGGCGCIMLAGTLIYIPMGLLLVTGILKDIPAWLQGQNIPGLELPVWGYLVTGLICALGLLGTVGVNLKKWWGLLGIYLATLAFIGLDVMMGARPQNRLWMLVWPVLITILLWAPWKKKAAPLTAGQEIDHRPPAILREQPRPRQEPGKITTIRAEDLPSYRPPAGTAAALAQIARMKTEGNIQGLLYAKANSLGHEDNNAASKALSAFDLPEIVPDLIEALGADSDDVREEVVNMLGRSSDARAFRPLLDALADPSGKVRGGSAYHLGGFHNKRAVEPLIKCLVDTDPYVRMGAAKSLGELGDPSAVDPLIRQLQDTDVMAAMAAAMGLGNIGDLRARQPLVNLLKHQWDAPRSFAPLYNAAMQALQQLDKEDG